MRVVCTAEASADASKLFIPKPFKSTLSRPWPPPLAAARAARPRAFAALTGSVFDALGALWPTSRGPAAARTSCSSCFNLSTVSRVSDICRSRRSPSSSGYGKLPDCPACSTLSVGSSKYLIRFARIGCCGEARMITSSGSMVRASVSERRGRSSNRDEEEVAPKSPLFRPKTCVTASPGRSYMSWIQPNPRHV